MSAAEFVRRHYGVPAKLGMRVTVNGRPGIVTGFACARIRVRFEDDADEYPEIAEEFEKEMTK
jgi:hypothetical protein